jgi:hypothetical protein
MTRGEIFAARDEADCSCYGEKSQAQDARTLLHVMI